MLTGSDVTKKGFMSNISTQRVSSLASFQCFHMFCFSCREDGEQGKLGISVCFITWWKREIVKCGKEGKRRGKSFIYEECCGEGYLECVWQWL